MTPVRLKKGKEIQKVYVGNNLVRPVAAKKTAKRPSRGTRKSRKSIDKDKKIDETIYKIDSAIGVLTSKLSEFVTRKELNTRLAELEQNRLNRYGESEAQRLRDQFNAVNQQPSNKAFQRQSSVNSGISYNTADLFERRSPANKNKSTSKNK